MLRDGGEVRWEPTGPVTPTCRQKTTQIAGTTRMAPATMLPTGNDRAETRTRQEYYSELRVTVSREESAVARQTTAEEQAATEKWQETTAESRWIWSEYQRKWPPTERQSADRSTDPSGSWYGERGRSLDNADNSRVEAECDHIARREEERISPAMRSVESQDPDRHLVGFEHRLKGRDRIKEKVYDKMEEFSYSAEEAVSAVSDTIRYTFQYREARYTQGVWTDHGTPER